MKDNYTLVKKTGKELCKFKVTLIADSNDGDYMTDIELYDKEDFDNHIYWKIVNLLENYSGSHDLTDYYDDEGWIEIPRTDYGENCHTLKSLTVEYIDENGTIYDVKFN